MTPEVPLWLLSTSGKSLLGVNRSYFRKYLVGIGKKVVWKIKGHWNELMEVFIRPFSRSCLAFLEFRPFVVIWRSTIVIAIIEDELRGSIMVGYNRESLRHTRLRCYLCLKYHMHNRSGQFGIFCQKTTCLHPPSNFAEEANSTSV